MPSPSRLRQPSDFGVNKSTTAAVLSTPKPDPSTSTAQPSAPGSASKWNATSELLQSGEQDQEDSAPELPNGGAGAAAQTTMIPASASAATSNKPPVPKSAWTSQLQTQKMLSSHTSTAASATGTSNGSKSKSTLSTKSPAFKPMQLVLSPANSITNGSSGASGGHQVIEIVPIESSTNAIEPAPHTPPPRGASSMLHGNPYSSLGSSSSPIEEGGFLSPSSSTSTTGHNPASLSPLQKRLNSPERLQMRHRPFVVAALASALPIELDASIPLSATDASVDSEALLAANLASLSQSKQEKAAKLRQEHTAKKKKQGEVVASRLTDAEQRRETKLRTKVEQSDTRLALAAEKAEEALETKRRRAESENQKVKELQFINAQAREERQYAIQAKIESSEARAKAVQQQRMEKITSSNSRTTAVVDERKRAERESQGKKQTEHAQIDARLGLAEARRKENQVSKIKGGATSASSTAVGTPNESPFTSPRTGSEMFSATIAGVDVSATAAQLVEDLPELDASFCTLCKVKLNTSEYVRRHVAGKKHQSLIAEQMISAAAAPSPATNIPDNAAAADTTAGSNGATSSGAALGSSVSHTDTYIVSLSSLASFSSATKTPLRYLTEPMALTAPSKSSRRNQKKKARKLRQQLTSSGSGAGGDESAGEEEDQASGDATAAGEDHASANKPRKESSSASNGEPTLEDLAAFPTTRLYTQVSSLLAVIERVEKGPVRTAPSPAASDDSASSSSKQLAVHTDDIELHLQEELQSVLVRLDEELTLLKTDTTGASKSVATTDSTLR